MATPAGPLAAPAPAPASLSLDPTVPIDEVCAGIGWVSGDARWCISSDHTVLHIGPGQLKSVEDWDTNNPWLYGSEYTAIVFHGTPDNPTYAAPSSQYLFAKMPKVTQVVNPQGLDVSRVENMSHFFDRASSLTSIDVSSWDTSNVTNMGAVFSGNSSLEQLDVSAWQTGNVTDMSALFSGTTSLQTLDLSQWDTSNVQYMGGMFVWTGLESLDLSGWNTGSLENIAYMFSAAENLQSLDLGSWDTSHVTDATQMFAEAGRLADLNISGWDTSSLTAADSMFYGAGSLTSIDVSGWDTQNLESASNMFQGTSSLIELDVSGWNTRNLRDATLMFFGASALENLDVSNWDVRALERAEVMFGSTTSLTSLDLSRWQLGATKTVYTNGMFDGSGVTALNLQSWTPDPNMGVLYYGFPTLVTDITIGSSFPLAESMGIKGPAASLDYSGDWVKVDAEGNPIVNASGELEFLGSTSELIAYTQDPGTRAGRYIAQPSQVNVVFAPGDAEGTQISRRTSFMAGSTSVLSESDIQQAGWSKPGYSFVDWVETDGSVVSGETAEFPQGIMPEDTIVFVAQWEKDPVAVVGGGNPGEQKPVSPLPDAPVQGAKVQEVAKQTLAVTGYSGLDVVILGSLLGAAGLALVAMRRRKSPAQH